MVIGSCIVELDLPGVHSLKEKRSLIKGLIARLRREFNVSCAEVGYHDAWGSAALGIAVVSTSAAHAQIMCDNVARWIANHRPDVTVIDHTVEVIH